ncbi:hypothetical protein [Jonquetella anthropi]|uniref:hypothetical protein n=1 Tax=Jonquetella anthropi TaxID=428712 RepID=UPI0023EFCE4F|nr:hypothetical protein [Jonquetella anthropi]
MTARLHRLASFDGKGQVPSPKPQAPSPKPEAPSPKPQARSPKPGLGRAFRRSSLIRHL